LAIIGYGLDDGQRRWQMPATPFTEVPSTIEPMVILSHGHRDRMLQAVDRASGVLRWRSDLGGPRRPKGVPVPLGSPGRAHPTIRRQAKSQSASRGT